MHDLDRTQLELEPELYETGEYGFETNGYAAEFELPISEAEEMELASALLEVSSDAELDQLLGNLFKKTGRAIGRSVKSPIGRSLGGMLKGVVKKAIPVVRGGLGSMVAPGIGTAIGSSLAPTAGQMFGLELEGLSAEDQEFEVARRLVRLGVDAAQKSASIAPSVPPSQAAKTALIEAAKKHAPGLLTQGGAPAGISVPSAWQQSGTWFRRGRRIILLGV